MEIGIFFGGVTRVTWCLLLNGLSQQPPGREGHPLGSLLQRCLIMADNVDEDAPYRIKEEDYVVLKRGDIFKAVQIVPKK